MCNHENLSIKRISVTYPNGFYGEVCYGTHRELIGTCACGEVFSEEQMMKDPIMCMQCIEFQDDEEEL